MYGRRRPEIRPTLEQQYTPSQKIVQDRRTVAVLQDDTSKWITVSKASDESRSAVTAFATDGALFFTMAASTKYVIHIDVWFDTVAAADFKWQLTHPAAAALLRFTREHIIPGGAAIVCAVDTGSSSQTVAGGGTNGGYVRVRGVFHNGVNAGVFGFQWAQDTSDAGATIVRAGSVLQYKVA